MFSVCVVFVQVKSSPGMDDDGYETAGKKPLPRKQPNKDTKKDVKKVCESEVAAKPLTARMARGSVPSICKPYTTYMGMYAHAFTYCTKHCLLAISIVYKQLPLGNCPVVWGSTFPRCTVQEVHLNVIVFHCQSFAKGFNIQGWV